MNSSAYRQQAPLMASTKPLLRWSILILRSKARALGDVEATSEAEAIPKRGGGIQEDPKGRWRFAPA